MKETLLAPVICKCSNEQSHVIDHIECRCTGWYLFREGFKPPYPEKFIFPKNCKLENDGVVWELCRYCGKVCDWPGYLMICPECGTKFLGPQPYFPIDYECENCE